MRAGRRALRWALGAARPPGALAPSPGVGRGWASEQEAGNHWGGPSDLVWRGVAQHRSRWRPGGWGWRGSALAAGMDVRRCRLQLGRLWQGALRPPAVRG
eukprot:2450847-Alexandrium_andersonii.AAC.1